MLVGLTPSDDDAEMVGGSQGRKSTGPSDQVTFKSDFLMNTFQMITLTRDVAEGRKSTAPSDQVTFKSSFLKNTFNFSDDHPNWG